MEMSILAGRSTSVLTQPRRGESMRVFRIAEIVWSLGTKRGSEDITESTVNLLINPA
jgi:hypothetical protein